MAYVLGTDEAGYGPKLGPLCIACSAWEVPEGLAAENLYRTLASSVAAEPDSSVDRLAIADSKRLYKSGGSIGLLERGVLASLAAIDRLPKCWRDLWRAVAGNSLTLLDSQPWHAEYDEPLPVDTLPKLLASGRAALSEGCSQRGVRIAELQAAVLFPAAFNAEVNQLGNKAELLSLTTLRLARRVLEDLPPQRAVVFCDKHGGRNYYSALLQHVFPEELVRPGLESGSLSTYGVRLRGQAVEFRFQPQGECQLPTALASMTAKYLRELAMRPFNAFWQRHVAGLKPTAGYYTDAQRFISEIRAAQERLAVPDHTLWRER